uniref:Vitellogenin domain-containing protein n=1 Tax=Salmo trutta TaxID=8032 RepID=A0A674F5Z4_SALTR
MVVITAPEFVYKYEALLLGGLPEECLARAGEKVISIRLHIKFTNKISKCILVDPEIFEYSGIWPKDPSIPAAKLTTALTAQLNQVCVRLVYFHIHTYSTSHSPLYYLCRSSGSVQDPLCDQ